MSTKQAKNHTANPCSHEDGHYIEQAFLRLGDVLVEIARSVNYETLETGTNAQLPLVEQDGGETVRNRDRDQAQYDLSYRNGGDDANPFPTNLVLRLGWHKRAR